MKYQEYILQLVKVAILRASYFNLLTQARNSEDSGIRTQADRARKILKLAP